MSSKRRKLFVIISIISAVSILFGTVVAAEAWSEGGISELWNSITNKDGVVKYEKPSVGEIAQDGAYPDEVKSNSSANAQEKKWYEYITYSKTPLDGEVTLGSNQRVVFYDPYDYSYGMIMELSNPSNNFGDYYNGEEGYTTANEISVSYSHTKSYLESDSWHRDYGLEEEFGAKVPALLDGTMKMNQTWGWSGDTTTSDSDTAQKNVTYNAMYFNANGTPYRWRIVKYKVTLPLFCELQTLVNGEWVVTETNYYMITTVEGTCREWIENGTAYIEDWRDGDKVAVEDFWGEFLNEDNLKKAYEDKLLPES